MAAQIIGILAVAAFVLSYQCRSNKALFFIQAIGLLLFSLQYYMLNALAGSLSLIVCLIRNVMLLRVTTSKVIQWKGWPWIFSVVLLIITIATWGGYRSLLSLAGTIAGTFGYWDNNAGRIRLCNLLVISPCWIVYAMLSHSIGGVLNELIAAGSIIISIKRFGWQSLMKG